MKEKSKMTTKQLAMIAAAALIATAAPSHARIWQQASVLNKACQAGTADGETQCVNYIMGALNGIETADLQGQLTPEQLRRQKNGEDIGGDPPYRFICMPDKPELFPVVNHVRQMLNLHLKRWPSDGEFPAADLVFVILSKEYPCKARR